MRVRASMFVGLLALALLWQWPGHAQAGDTPDPAKDQQASDAAAATRDASNTQPQVPTFRGGSLGIPVLSGSGGVQAAAVGKVGAVPDAQGSSVDFGFLTKLGGLRLGDTISADVLGESYDQEIPQVVVGAAGALPKMTTTTITSAGIRLRYKIGGYAITRYAFDDVAQESVSRADLTTSTQDLQRVTAQVAFRGDVGKYVVFGLRVLHPGVDKADAKRVAGVAGELIYQQSTSLEAKGGTARPCMDSTLEAAATPDDKGAQALRDACLNGDQRRTWFVSVSATHLNDQLVQADDGLMLELPAFSELRASGGLELQAGKETAGVLLPRMGVYATAARGSWTNEFVTGATQAPDVHGWQFEAAIYASGHFTGGFAGLVSVGLLVPYGHDSDVQGFVMFSPSVGTGLGGGK